jgi:glycosyltransferase involved in cell wall biosynthesis
MKTDKSILMNERIPQSPPVIDPVPEFVDRPLWSVMIPTYNCSQYLIENLRSVLEQDPGEEYMQIEVVDDCSTDTDVEALVRKIGKGRIGYFRQPNNVGSLRNFETCLNRSTGHYIHLLHGDDRVKQGFYLEIQKVFKTFPEAGAAFTGFTFVDEQNQRLYDNKELLYEPGVLKNWLSEIARAQLIQPPAMVVKRPVYEKLGSFYGVHYGEDWEMWVRIAANYPVAHSPKKLALYRVHQSNITSRYFLSGQSITDVLKVVDMIQEFLPENERARVKRFTKKHLAHYFSYTSDKIYHMYGRPYIALEQSKRAMNMHFSHITFLYWLKIKIKILIGYKMQREKKWLYRPINFFR